MCRDLTRCPCHSRLTQRDPYNRPRLPFGNSHISLVFLDLWIHYYALLLGPTIGTSKIDIFESHAKMLLLKYQIILLWFSLELVLTQDDEYPGKIDCYSWTGQVFPNNTQCPGSRICCQTADLCDPNRFCLQNSQIIVPACAVFPWDNCANICQYGRSPSRNIFRVFTLITSNRSRNWISTSCRRMQ